MSKTHWYAPFKGHFQTLTADPDEGPFLCVKFNVQYAPFIRGAIFAMLQRQMWTGSDSELDLMRMRVQQLLYIFGQQTDCVLPADLTGEYEVMASLCESLRFQNGKLQALCCGEWTDIDGQLPGSNGEQPGMESPQPVPGGCESYHAAFNATQQWLLPTRVNAGDVLSFSNPRGLAADGSGSGLQYCPSGNVALLGECIGFFGSVPGDPLNTAPHMCVIAQIAGVWYDTGADITVPPGVEDAGVTFQVNDATLSDNAGGYNFDVEVCSGAPTRWCYRFNFLGGDGGFVVYTNPPDSVIGVYTPGVGWEDTENVNGAGVGRRGLILTKTMPSGTVITRVVAEVDFTPGLYDATEAAQAIETSDTNLFLKFNGSTINGSGVFLDTGITTETDNLLAIRLVSDRQTGSIAGFSGNVRLKAITVYGEGDNPFGDDNCSSA